MNKQGQSLHGEATHNQLQANVATLIEKSFLIISQHRRLVRQRHLRRELQLGHQ